MTMKASLGKMRWLVFSLLLTGGVHAQSWQPDPKFFDVVFAAAHGKCIHIAKQFVEDGRLLEMYSRCMVIIYSDLQEYEGE